MNKIIIFTALSIITLLSACNKHGHDNYTASCQPVEVPSFGFGTPINFSLQPTEEYNYTMTFSNDHDYPIEFNVEFRDVPEHMQAVIERSNFSLTSTKNYFLKVSLTTKNAEPGTYKVPVVVTTDKDGEMSAILEIKVGNDVAADKNNPPQVTSYTMN